MCRWIAYQGDQIYLDTLLTKPNHSLLDQSINARHLRLQTSPLAHQFRDHEFPTNGDGFGMAWVGPRGTLGQFHEVTPAWDSQNLRSLAEQISAPVFLAHVRAAPGGTISQQNCHPFVQDGWMFQHNGNVGGFDLIRRELCLEIAPRYFSQLRGNSDTEVCFYLALTYGLTKDPVTALVRLRDRIELARAENGIQAPFTATMAATAGNGIYALRTSSVPAEGQTPTWSSPTLYFAHGPIQIRLHDGSQERLPENAQLVVSEPVVLDFSDRTWQEVPDQSVTTFQLGRPPEHVALT